MRDILFTESKTVPTKPKLRSHADGLSRFVGYSGFASLRLNSSGYCASTSSGACVVLLKIIIFAESFLVPTKPKLRSQADGFSRFDGYPSFASLRLNLSGYCASTSRGTHLIPVFAE